MAKRKTGRKRGGFHGRRVRRNPPRVGKLIGPVFESARNAFLVVAGKWGAGYIGQYVGGMLPTVSANPEYQKAFGQAVTAALATVAAAFFLPAKVVPYVGVGAFVAPAETLIKGFNVPFINQGLGTYLQPGQRPYLIGAGTNNAQMGAYLQPPRARLAGDALTMLPGGLPQTTYYNT